MDLFDLFAKISIDTSEFENGIESASAGFKRFSGDSKSLSDDIKRTESQFQSAQKKVQDLSKALEESAQLNGEDSDETRKLAEELKKAQSDADGFETALKGMKDGLKGVGDESGNAGSKLEWLSAKAVAVGSILADAIEAGAKAVVNLGKNIVDNYAQYEQLTGGVETLFKDSSSTIFQYADQAYKTAGMSANAYMDTITGFAASLIQGLGGDTEKAAEIANMAVEDMSDNSNKMGTHMEDIENAYQGFAKQNYTMLDNLKLGYGGTQEEMIRLINDSGILNEKISSMDGITFDQIIQAIHAIQDNLDITGTTAKEASTTIEGSFNSASAAWQNLLTGIGNGNADIGTLADEWVSSVGTYLGNLIPTIATVIPKLIEAMAESAGEMITGFASGIDEKLPEMKDKAVEALKSFVSGLMDSSDSGELFESAAHIITKLVEAFIQVAPYLALAAVALMGKLVEFLMGLVGTLMQAGIDLVLDLVSAIVSKAESVGSAAKTLIQNFITGIGNKLGEVKAKAAEIVDAIKSSIQSKVEEAKQWGIDLINNFISGIKSKFESLRKAISDAADVVASFLHFSEPDEGPLSNFHTFAPDMIDLFVKGIYDNRYKVQNASNTVANDVSGAFNKIFGGYSDLGIDAKITDTSKKGVKEASDKAKAVYDASTKWLEDAVEKENYTLDEQLKAWQMIQGQFIESSEQYKNAEEKIYDLKNKIYEQGYKDKVDWINKEVKYNDASLQEQILFWSSLQKEYLEDSEKYEDTEEKLFDLRKELLTNYESSAETIYKNIEKIQDTYQKSLESSTQNIVKSYGLFDEVPESEYVSGQQLLYNLQDQIQSIQGFYDKLDKLKERGLNADLLAELRDMGVDAADQVNAIFRMSDDDIQKYSDLYEQKNQLASNIAMDELKDLREETNAEVLKNLEDLGDLYEENAPFIGQMFADGLAKGIQNGLSTVLEASTEMANKAMEAAEKALNLDTNDIETFNPIAENDRLKDIAGNVDFSDSGLGVSAASIINTLIQGKDEKTGETTINLVMADGTKMASWIFDPLTNYAKANGTPIVNPA